MDHMNIATRICSRLLETSFVPSAVGFLLVLIGGRFLLFTSDENLFLHLAWSHNQGWSSQFEAFSYPYAMYRDWLALFLSKNEPNSIWNALFADIAAQSIAILLTITAPIILFRIRNFVSILAIITGVLFFFTVGRLAEHRPDYISVTLFNLGIQLLSKTLLDLEKREFNRIHLCIIGLLLCLAVSFSPRTLVVLGVTGALFFFYLLFIEKFKSLVQMSFYLSLGGLFGFFLLWSLFDFNLLEALQISANPEFVVGDPITLEGRISHLVRETYSIMILMVTLATLASIVLYRHQPARLVFLLATCIAAGQIVLIVLDSRIYGYGYSYILPGYVALIVGLEKTGIFKQIGVIKLRTIFGYFWLTSFSVFYLSQMPSVIKSDGYYYMRHPETSVNVEASTSNVELLKVLGKSNTMLDRIRANIYLCERAPDALYLSTFNKAVICLNSAYNLHPSYKRTANVLRFESQQYVANQVALNEALGKLGKSRDSAGVIFFMDSNDNGTATTTEAVEY